MLNTYYSVKKSYALGDKYLRTQKYLAAEACYALPEMDDHSQNLNEAGDVNTKKLQDLKEIHYEIPPKGTDMDQTLLLLIRDFYKPWLEGMVKPAMITRSRIHAQFRKQAVIQVFKETTGKYDMDDTLDHNKLDEIASLSQQQQFRKIKTWQGPNFKTLQYCTKQNWLKSNKAKKISKLTVVMDQKLFRKRCLNSQEDWFKKFDGVFFMRCLKEILKTLNNCVEDEDDRKFVKLKFVKNILEKKIKFKSASPRILIPAGTLFACKGLMEILTEFHPELDALGIKKEKGTAVRPKYKKLMRIINSEYYEMVDDDDDSSDDDDISSAFEMDIPEMDIGEMESPSKPVAPPLPPFPSRDESKREETEETGQPEQGMDDFYQIMREDITDIVHHDTMDPTELANLPPPLETDNVNDVYERSSFGVIGYDEIGGNNINMQQFYDEQTVIQSLYPTQHYPASYQRGLPPAFPNVNTAIFDEEKNTIIDDENNYGDGNIYFDSNIHGGGINGNTPLIIDTVDPYLNVQATVGGSNQNYATRNDIDICNDHQPSTQYPMNFNHIENASTMNDNCSFLPSSTIPQMTMSNNMSMLQPSSEQSTLYPSNNIDIGNACYQETDSTTYDNHHQLPYGMNSNFIENPSYFQTLTIPQPNMPNPLPSLSPGTQMTVSNNISMAPPSSGQSSLYPSPQPYHAYDTVSDDTRSIMNTLVENDQMEPSFMSAICPGCDEIECKCNNYNNINQNNNMRVFQSTYNFINPSNRIHQQISSRSDNNRAERQSAHIMHMRERWAQQ